jgi:dTDP-4-amino-4,6-dideoxygalactose transaminase
VALPLFDTSGQMLEVREDLNRAIAGVIDSGRFILGPEVEQFERDLADYLGVRHVIGVANGTDALAIALRCLGVEPGKGHEVIVPAFTFYATAEAVVLAGGVPVFCDVDPRTFSLEPGSVQRLITSATRAVVPVHLFGSPVEIEELQSIARDNGIRVLEDAAQAAGARQGDAKVGGLGDAAAFSFFPSKNLFCLGDGGAICTSDEDVAKRSRLLRVRGSSDHKRTFTEVGWNSRLDAIQAAVLQVVLPRLVDWNHRRRALATAYEEAGRLPPLRRSLEPSRCVATSAYGERHQLPSYLRGSASSPGSAA